MRPTVRHQLIIIAVATLVFFTNLGAAPLWDRDEPRNAGCAVEMLRRGDWVVPVFNAELRTHKPVLLYWFLMTAYAAFGVTEFAARFWSAVFGVGTSLATYHIGRRLFNAEIGLWGGVILATSLMFGVAARAATPDSVLIFFTTLATLVYVVSTFKPGGMGGLSALEAGSVTGPTRPGCYFPNQSVAALMYALMGGAVLAKGPVGLVLPTAVIGMFLLVMRLPATGDPVTHAVAKPQAAASRRSGTLSTLNSRLSTLLRPFAPAHFFRTCLAMRPLTALAASLAVALPWYVWVAVRTDGAWVEGFLLEHNVGRAMHAMEGHGGGFWYYPVAVLFGFFPWSLFLTPLLIELVGRIRQRDRWYPGYLFVACWIGVYVALFSLARTKLPNYVTPMYPALALATGCFLYHWTRGTALPRPIWMRTSMPTLGLVGVVLLIATPLAARRYVPGEAWLALIGLIPLAGAGVCYFLMSRNSFAHAARMFAMTAFAFTTVLFGWAAVRVGRHQQIDALLGAVHSRGSEARIASFGCHEPSWVYYAGEPVREISRYEPNAAAEFLSGGIDSYLITTDRRLAALKSEVPNLRVVTSTPYFLKRSNLVLIAGTAESIGTAMSHRKSTARK